MLATHSNKVGTEAKQENQQKVQKTSLCDGMGDLHICEGNCTDAESYVGLLESAMLP